MRKYFSSLLSLLIAGSSFPTSVLAQQRVHAVRPNIGATLIGGLSQHGAPAPAVFIGDLAQNLSALGSLKVDALGQEQRTLAALESLDVVQAEGGAAADTSGTMAKAALSAALLDPAVAQELSAWLKEKDPAVAEAFGRAVNRYGNDFAEQKKRETEAQARAGASAEKAAKSFTQQVEAILPGARIFSDNISERPEGHDVLARIADSAEHLRGGDLTGVLMSRGVITALLGNQLKWPGLYALAAGAGDRKSANVATMSALRGGLQEAEAGLKPISDIDARLSPARALVAPQENALGDIAHGAIARLQSPSFEDRAGRRVYAGAVAAEKAVVQGNTEEAVLILQEMTREIVELLQPLGAEQAQSTLDDCEAHFQSALQGNRQDPRRPIDEQPAGQPFRLFWSAGIRSAKASLDKKRDVGDDIIRQAVTQVQGVVSKNRSMATQGLGREIDAVGNIGVWDAVLGTALASFRSAIGTVESFGAEGKYHEARSAAHASLGTLRKVMGSRYATAKIGAMADELNSNIASGKSAAAAKMRNKIVNAADPKSEDPLFVELLKSDPASEFAYNLLKAAAQASATEIAQFSATFLLGQLDRRTVLFGHQEIGPMIRVLDLATETFDALGLGERAGVDLLFETAETLESMFTNSVLGGPVVSALKNAAYTSGEIFIQGGGEFGAVFENVVFNDVPRNLSTLVLDLSRISLMRREGRERKTVGGKSAAISFTETTRASVQIQENVLAAIVASFRQILHISLPIAQLDETRQSAIRSFLRRIIGIASDVKADFDRTRKAEALNHLEEAMASVDVANGPLDAAKTRVIAAIWKARRCQKITAAEEFLADATVQVRAILGMGDSIKAIIGSIDRVAQSLDRSNKEHAANYLRLIAGELAVAVFDLPNPQGVAASQPLDDRLRAALSDPELPVRPLSNSTAERMARAIARLEGFQPVVRSMIGAEVMRVFQRDIATAAGELRSGDVSATVNSLRETVTRIQHMLVLNLKDSDTPVEGDILLLTDTIAKLKGVKKSVDNPKKLLEALGQIGVVLGGGFDDKESISGEGLLSQSMREAAADLKAIQKRVDKNDGRTVANAAALNKSLVKIQSTLMLYRLREILDQVGHDGLAETAVEPYAAAARRVDGARENTAALSEATADAGALLATNGYDEESILVARVNDAMVAADSFFEQYTREAAAQARSVLLETARKGEAAVAMSDPIDETIGFENLSTTLSRMGMPPFATDVYGNPVFEEEEGGETALPQDPTRDAIVVNSMWATRGEGAQLSPALRQAGRQRFSQAELRMPDGQVATVTVETRSHIVIDPSWVERRLQVDTRPFLMRLVTPQPAKYDLFLHKAVLYDGSKVRLVAYKKPVQVDYYNNFFTLGSDDRDDGHILERDTDVPQTHSARRLGHWIKDKLHTRLVQQEARQRGANQDSQMMVPTSLGFYMPGSSRRAEIERLANEARRQTPVTVDAKLLPQQGGRVDAAGVRQKVEGYLAAHPGINAVIVKGGGDQFAGGLSVKIFGRNDVAGMVKHVSALANDPGMTQEGSILVDGFVSGGLVYAETEEYKQGHPYTIRGWDKSGIRFLSKEEIVRRRADGTLDPKLGHPSNIRVWVYRQPNGDPVPVISNVRIGGYVDTTLQAVNTIMVTYEDWERNYAAQNGITPEAMARFKARLLHAHVAKMKTFNEYEPRIARKDGDPHQDRLDIIGTDIMPYISPDGEVFPVCIEDNGHAAGSQRQYDTYHDRLNGGDGRMGEHSADLLNLITARALGHALAGTGVEVVRHIPAPYVPHSDPKTRLIVGLGNHHPEKLAVGKVYTGSRHNLGSDLIATDGWQEFFGPTRQLLGHFLPPIAEGLPMFFRAATYYDDQGPALRAFADLMGIVPAEMLLIYDDMSLPLGKVVIQGGGPGAGNRGLNDPSQTGIFDVWGGYDGFPRVRIGIGDYEVPADGGRSARDAAMVKFLVTPMSPSETGSIKPALALAAQWAEFIIEHGIVAAMAEADKSDTPPAVASRNLQAP